MIDDLLYKVFPALLIIMMKADELGHLPRRSDTGWGIDNTNGIVVVNVEGFYKPRSFNRSVRIPGEDMNRDVRVESETVNNKLGKSAFPVGYEYRLSCHGWQFRFLLKTCKIGQSNLLAP